MGYVISRFGRTHTNFSGRGDAKLEMIICRNLLHGNANELMNQLEKNEDIIYTHFLLSVMVKNKI